MNKKVKGNFVKCLGEEMYKISDFDRMPPFFMTMVSSSELWMYLSSTGCLTAGRSNPDNAIFPYYTVDKIHENASNTGPITLIKVKDKLWQPFSTDRIQPFSIQRNLYKNSYGSKVLFEEINLDLKLRFRYSWSLSENYGFVREAHLKNLGAHEYTVHLMDGVQNVMPSGVSRMQQMTLSNLMDAYKRTELHPETGLGLFYLNAIPVDRAEPSESLSANVAWHHGLTSFNTFINPLAIDNFVKGLSNSSETEMRAGRGAYLLESNLNIASEQEKNWAIIIDQGYNAAKLSTLDNLLKDKNALIAKVRTDLEAGEASFKKLVGSADGFQLTANRHSCVRHFYNTLFNIMRGGVFYDNYYITKTGLLRHVEIFNKDHYKKSYNELNALPEKFTLQDLSNKLEQLNDPNLSRIVKEYLPIIFSRRHGDPSRPWNIFNVSLKDELGNTKFYYQGNWRDIFQNWEALLYSFPEFTENIIAKFVNASTADGYNPYRISSEGIDWEETEPDDPWSFIGYWGDHQVIYLQKLLEVSHKLHPGKIKKELKTRQYVYSHVPYIIKGFDGIIEDPYSTILFDEELNKNLLERFDEKGADGKLYFSNGSPLLVNLAEKLLVSTLTKLYNLIPDAGIWLNTQRPEWNDANNALVGYGCSMVTVYYLHRQIVFYKELFKGVDRVELTDELADLFATMKEIYKHNEPVLKEGFNGKSRWNFVETLGRAGEKYRESVYKRLSNTSSTISEEDILGFLNSALRYIEKSIEHNKRQDGMFHAYNLIDVHDKSIEVNHLYEMLEGQVAVLSANYLSGSETLEVLEALRNSAMYREDQESYMLYPNRELPLFMEKNLPKREKVERIPTLLEMIKNSNKKVIYKDAKGNYRFTSNLKNSNYLKEILSSLVINKNDTRDILALYEDTFQHRFFTGRSGTFFGYEGLGCIYWHMVSKLKLAIAENLVKAKKENASMEIQQLLKQKYYEVKKGIGANKPPEDYGAFPMEPYSHTPGRGGVKQPGMTGQVKEDILSRMYELGFAIENGEINISPELLREEEFLTEEKKFSWIDISGNWQNMTIPADHLVFTFSQVPFLVKKSDRNSIEWKMINGESNTVTDTLKIPKTISDKLFQRDGEIEKIIISLNR